MPFGTIYKITNTFNEKLYIGQTVQELQRRWELHCSDRSANRFFVCINDAAKWVDEKDFRNKAKNINACLKNKQKTAFGFTWRYTDV